MHLNRFDLNLLLALDALLQEKHVTRAAERTQLSQPAMSAALIKLRDYFGDPLLTRVGRDMCLTPRGLALLGPVREALLRVQATLGTQRSFDAATTLRRFSVIVRDHIVSHLMPGVLRRVLLEAPGVQCAVEDVTHTCLSQLEQGDSDLAVLIDNPGLFGLASFPDWMCVEKLRRVRWVCVVCANHPYIRDTLTEELYLSMPHVLAKPQGSTLSTTELLRRIKAVDLDVRVTTQSSFELPFILPGTQLIATVPESVASLLTPLLPLRTFLPPVAIADSREVLLWHRRNSSDPAHAWLRGIFIATARENGTAA